METGFIKINRAIMGNWVYQDKQRLGCWLDLLLMANWEDREVMHDTHRFTLRRGQMIASRSYLATRWHLTESTTQRFVSRLEEDGMIKREVISRKTAIITIINYEKYQGDWVNGLPNGLPNTITDGLTDGLNADEQKESKESVNGITDGQANTIPNTQANTIKRNKEIKNKEKGSKDPKKNESESRVFVPPDVEEVREYCQSRHNTIDAEEFVAFYASKGWMIGKNKMKSWRNAVITWEKKREQRQTNLFNPNITQKRYEDSNRNNEADRARDERLQESAGIVADLLRNLRPAASD